MPDGAYPFCDGQVWADPDIKHAASLMRRIASDERYRPTSRWPAKVHQERKNYSQEVMASQYAKRLHDIHILNAASSHTSNCEMLEQATAAHMLHGNIDSPNLEQCRGVSDVLPVEGWVASPDPIDMVKVYVDATFIGDAHYGIPRPDVHAAFPTFPDAGRSGFCYLLNIASLTDGEHSLSVVAHCRAGSLRQWTIPFSKQESFRYQEWLRNTKALYAPATSVPEQQPGDLRMSLVLRLTYAIDTILLTGTLSSLAAQQDGRFELLVLLENAEQEGMVTQIASQAFPKGEIRFVVGRGSDWDLLVANCRAAFIGLVDPGDIFTPWAFRDLISSRSTAAKWTSVCHEYSWDMGNRRDPIFKPGWSPIFLETFNLCRPTVVRVANNIRLQRLPELSGRDTWMSEHEVLKVIGEKSMVVAHVPTVLVSRSGTDSSMRLPAPISALEPGSEAADRHWPKVSIIHSRRD